MERTEKHMEMARSAYHWQKGTQKRRKSTRKYAKRWVVLFVEARKRGSEWMITMGRRDLNPKREIEGTPH